MTDALAFLRVLRPEGPWVLTAIEPDGPGIRTKTFPAGQKGEAALKAFVVEYEGKWNLYYSPNRMLKAISKKPGKVDVKSMDFFQVDIDPRAGEDFTAAVERITGVAGRAPPNGIPSPSLTVFSGGGVQLFWRLKEPIEIDGDKGRALEAERYNRYLVNAYQGDMACADCCHVMRLPGTTNVLNKKKIEKGRKPAQAYLIDLPDPGRVYKASQFQLAPPKDVDPGEAASTAQVVDLSELARWAVPDRIKVIITKGEGPTPKEGDNSRSAWLFDVCCNLVRHDVPEAAATFAIRSVLFTGAAPSGPRRCHQHEKGTRIHG